MNNNDKMSSFIEELKRKTDIVGLVSRYVQLERKGRMFWGRCPFHSEKTPSFVVNEYDGFYHCFGCGVGGDVIKFVEEIESLDFMGAVHFLADLAHIEVPSFSGQSDESDIKQRKQQKERLTALMRDAALHYVENLKNPLAKPGILYFEKRKISPQIARRFGLGFSVNFTEIIDYLKTKGYTVDEMKLAGVVKEKDGRPYDAIGGRIVFPIMDTANNVVAFCGRTLDPKPQFAKYINTADTPIFSKSKNLYAINLVKKAKQNGGIDSLIVVEGQMDVVSLHKAGFVSAVASMGTSLTNDQAKLMKRFTDKVYICYDGDTAGQKATLRGLDILKDNGLDVYVMSLPNGLDPDDIINKYGAEGYKKLMDRALPLVDFKFEFLKKNHDLESSEGRTKFLSEAIGVLRGLNEVEREVYIDKVSEYARVLKDFIKRQLENPAENEPKMSLSAAVSNENGTKTRERLPQDDKTVQAEKFILSALLHKRPYAHFTTNVEEYFTGNRRDFYKTIMHLDQNYPESELPQKFYETYAGHEENSNLADEASEIVNYILKNANDENDLGYYKDCVYIVFRAKLENDIKELSEQMDKEVDKVVRESLMKQIKEKLEKIKSKKVDL